MSTPLSRNVLIGRLNTNASPDAPLFRAPTHADFATWRRLLMYRRGVCRVPAPIPIPWASRSQHGRCALPQPFWFVSSQIHFTAQRFPEINNVRDNELIS